MMTNVETLWFQNPSLIQADPYSESRVSYFVILFISPLIITAISISTLPGFNYLVIAIGVVCAVAYLIASFRGGFIFPKELICYIGFFLWSMWGFIFAPYPELVLTQLFTLFKLLVMVIIIAYYANNLKNTEALLISTLIGIGIVVISTFVTGEYRRVQETVGGRIGGLTLNANSFAMAVVFATLVLLYFLKVSKRLLVKLVIIPVIFLNASLVIASASRKGFIGFIAVLFLWGFFSYRKEIARKPYQTIIAICLLLAAGVFFYTKSSGTEMERRMRNMIDVFRGGSSEESISVRKEMIEKGIKLTISHPLVGVGLNNFRVYMEGYYAHNNYVEIFADTGIVGGILYYFIYIILGLRLYRLTKLPFSGKYREIINLGKTFLSLLLLWEIGFVSYYTKFLWIIMAIFIGFSYRLEEHFRRHPVNITLGTSGK